MTPFPWPDVKHELALSKEAAKYLPEKPQDCDEVAKTHGKAFSTDDKQVKGTERLFQLLAGPVLKAKKRKRPLPV